MVSIRRFVVQSRLDVTEFLGFVPSIVLMAALRAWSLSPDRNDLSCLLRALPSTPATWPEIESADAEDTM